MPEIPLHTIRDLKRFADSADQEMDWPFQSWQLLVQSELLRWSLPESLEGFAASRAQILQCHVEIAANCLVSALIYSQREAALRLLAQNKRLLSNIPQMTLYSSVLTVGLSQLTTSNQPIEQQLRATAKWNGHYELNGTVPWITASDLAEFIVVGATLEDGRQILVAIPAGHAGLTIEPPMLLSTLRGTRTGRIRFESSIVGPDLIIAGPKREVLGRSAGGGLETSALALGHARAAIDIIVDASSQWPEARDAGYRLSGLLDSQISRLLNTIAEEPSSHDVATIRHDATRLVLLATQSALITTKGSGLVVPHPAQRLGRQAQLFLTWSYPKVIANQMLECLTAC